MQRFREKHRVTVGVLFNPKDNRNIITTAAQVAKRLGLTLIAQEVNTPQELPEALNRIAKKVDVLWGISDQVASWRSRF